MSYLIRIIQMVSYVFVITYKRLLRQIIIVLLRVDFVWHIAAGNNAASIQESMSLKDRNIELCMSGMLMPAGRLKVESNNTGFTSLNANKEKD